MTVLPTGPYLLSRAAFPDYFLPDRSRRERVRCELDVRIFTEAYAPAFGIVRRYVGTEPLSPLTGQYNGILAAELPPRGVELRVIPRLERDGTPVSAGAVRALLGQGRTEELRRLVPAATFAYLEKRGLL